jgi:hypothetical protein
VEEYRCKDCPYFESWEEETVTKIEDSRGNVFNIPGKRIFFKCKNPEHEYLCSIKKS